MPSYYMAGKGISKEKNEAPARTAGKQYLLRAKEMCSSDRRLVCHALLCLPTGAKSSLVVRGETD